MHIYYYPVCNRSILPLIFTWFLSIFSLSAEGLEWKTMGHLLEKRSYFQSALIGKKTILIFGGFTQHYGNQLQRIKGIVSNTSEIINVEKRSVKPAARMNVSHASAAFVQTMDSNIIVVSGLTTDSTTTRMCEMYDRKTNTWKVVGELLIGRHTHTAAFINSEDILIVGGIAEANYGPTIAEAEILNIRTGKSRMIQEFPCRIFCGQVFKSHIWKPGRTLFIGGRSGGGGAYRLPCVYSFDTSFCKWNYEGEIPIATSGFALSQLINNQAVINVGGGKAYYYFANNYPKQTVASNTVCVETEDGFKSIGRLLQARYDSAVQPWSSDICLNMGGLEDREVISQTEWFDVKSGQSCLGPALKEPGMFINSFSFPHYDKFGKQIGACIVVFGGVGLNRVPLNNIEILETHNPVFIETPSEEITSLRWKKFYSSSQFVGILMAFISALILALGYLLYQVVQIRKKSRTFAHEKI